MARSVWKGPFVDMTLIKKAEKVANLNTVMSNSFGFGGTNAALIFEKV